jgi:hypothetical protein
VLGLMIHLVWFPSWMHGLTVWWLQSTPPYPGGNHTIYWRARSASPVFSALNRDFCMYVIVIKMQANLLQPGSPALCLPVLAVVASASFPLLTWEYTCIV